MGSDEKTTDPTNYKYERDKLRREMAEMAERAAQEITNLRRANERIAPRAEAFDAIQQLLDLMPRRSVGMGEDLAFQLERRAQALRDEMEHPE